jgi:hypothetical protein
VVQGGLRQERQGVGLLMLGRLYTPIFAASARAAEARWCRAGRFS